MQVYSCGVNEGLLKTGMNLASLSHIPVFIIWQIIHSYCLWKLGLAFSTIKKPRDWGWLYLGLLDELIDQTFPDIGQIFKIQILLSP